MFIIDFDDTLFDTHGFKQARLKAVEKIGISNALFWTTYKQARVNSDGVFTYSDKRHAEILASEGFKEEEIFTVLNKVTLNMKDFLAHDAEEFLQSLSLLKQPLILLSLGDSEFQELKVKSCGIAKYFERIFFVDKTKENVLEELFGATTDKENWLINDKVDESQQLQIHFPNLKVILKISNSFPLNIYKHSGLPNYRTLSEIKNYLENYYDKRI
ncbi:MAG: hypothetical protein US42_C0005G0002 [Candidatus Magasanikbacteria bacterium GW2011_GWC2_37_14]|uniref:Uncharacterized protein n=1 Tax=Candidatus Magasanikbacteria bacterium GW2011_GWC2_37_14 TaxID=1619046 RepID=A0A0G0GCS6_9BACT|nr:MAG: hypothetical protein US42_C0005G0002 [Candidatus Magasanikbacteria bacterium GW2011_GWC2_37_14]